MEYRIISELTLVLTTDNSYFEEPTQQGELQPSKHPEYYHQLAAITRSDAEVFVGDPYPDDAVAETMEVGV